MKISTLVALGVGLLVVVGLAVKFVVSDDGDAPPTVDVTLKLDGTNVCRPAAVPPLVGGAVNDIVTWRVTNVDCPPQYIGVGNFRPYKHGVPGSQDKKVIAPDPATGGPIPTSSIPFLLTATIIKRQFITKKIFKYDILLGPDVDHLVVRMDPDIEVWP